MLPRDFTSLEQIKVASPCPAKWRYMHGDDQMRHCSKCDRKVYNLSEMTRSEAMSLILRNEGHVCVRFYRREDGMVMTRDCGQIVKKRKRLAAWIAAFACAAGLARLIPALGAFDNATTGDMTPPPSAPTTGVVRAAPKPPAFMGKVRVPVNDHVQGEVSAESDH